MRWRAVWVGLVILVLGVEAFTVLHPTAGDTLSEQVWALLAAAETYREALLIGWLGFLGWLTWHWWYERRGP